MTRAIIFDYFGVIQPDIIDATYHHFGGDPVKDAAFISETMRQANLGLISSSREVFAKRLGIHPADWMASFSIPQDKQLLEYITQLKTRYKTGLLSNISRGRLSELFVSGPIEQYFDAAIGSGDVGIAKPDPRFYQMITEKLGVVPSECVFTDDKPKYCQPAQALGMQTIVYSNFAQFKIELEALLKSNS